MPTKPWDFCLGCRLTLKPTNYSSKTCSNGRTAQRHKLPWTYCLSWFLHDAYDGCMTMACETFGNVARLGHCLGSWIDVLGHTAVCEGPSAARSDVHCGRAKPLTSSDTKLLKETSRMPVWRKDLWVSFSRLGRSGVNGVYALCCQQSCHSIGRMATDKPPWRKSWRPGHCCTRLHQAAWFIVLSLVTCSDHEISGAKRNIRRATDTTSLDRSSFWVQSMSCICIAQLLQGRMDIGSFFLIRSQSLQLQGKHGEMCARFRLVHHFNQPQTRAKGWNARGWWTKHQLLLLEPNSAKNHIAVFSNGLLKERWNASE